MNRSDCETHAVEKVVAAWSVLVTQSAMHTTLTIKRTLQPDRQCLSIGLDETSGSKPTRNRWYLVVLIMSEVSNLKHRDVPSFKRDDTRGVFTSPDRAAL